VQIVEQHDGSKVALRKLAADHDVNDRRAAMNFLLERAAAGEIVTGLLYVEPESGDLHDHLGTVAKPLNALGERELCPGSAALEKLNAALR
jgi:2-oxoglutarate ferredoxin oxidoreductase subunit beta